MHFIRGYRNATFNHTNIYYFPKKFLDQEFQKKFLAAWFQKKFLAAWFQKKFLAAWFQKKFLAAGKWTAVL
jgi:hypothetical protein